MYYIRLCGLNHGWAVGPFLFASIPPPFLPFRSNMHERYREGRIPGLLGLITYLLKCNDVEITLNDVKISIVASNFDFDSNNKA